MLEVFRLAKFGLTPDSPVLTPDRPELILVEFSVLLIPVLIPVFMLLRSCPKLDRPLLILFEPMLELIAFN